MTKKAYFAAGCFWCTESDFSKLPGIESVVSGYAGGHVDNPTYEQVVSEKTGHRESIEVTYDSKMISYEYLVDYLIRGMNPTDAMGSFFDRGESYTPAIFYQTEEEKQVAEKVIETWNDKKVYRLPLAVKVLPYINFFPAEDYHQNYYLKNPEKYKAYREVSGHDAQRVENDKMFPRENA